MTNAKQDPARILLVEDEMLPSMLLTDVLTECGHQVRTVARLNKALQLARDETFDAAVLDVNLAGEQVFPLAALLREQHVPFLFSSGYGDAALPPEYRDCTVVQKPYRIDTFKAAVQALLAQK